MNDADTEYLNMSFDRNLNFNHLPLEITSAELDALSSDDYLLVDTRDHEDYEHGFIPGCVLFSPEQVRDYADGRQLTPFSQDKRIVLYCRYGTVTRELAEELQEKGYPAQSLSGGYGSWALYAIQKQAQNETLREEIELSLQKGRFHKDLLNPFARAVLKYNMIQDGDHIAVCISGGKDSMVMAKLFQEFRRHGQFHFDLTFLCMDPGYNEANRHIIESNAQLLGIPLVFFETTIFDTVYQIKSSPCYLCARMRRGHLYKQAKELGCNKIALGHHFDDVIETALMGMLYSGQWEAMLPKLKSTNFDGMQLIRPLYFIREDDIKAWRDRNHLHFIQCACHFTDTCTTCAVTPDKEGESSRTGHKRAETKRIIAELKKNNPGLETNIFHATENVCLDKLLGYKKDGIKHSFLENF
jgi:tRNA 2-thiocytidine biosynthesis protein TtcA